MEAGMNLYGNDMDDDTSPLEAGMGWTVDLKDEARDFVGKAPLLALKEKGVAVKQVGLLLAKGGVLRDHMEVVTDAGRGITTSGVFSPSLKQSIAIARVPKDFDGDAAKVIMRGKEVDVRVLKLPFVRNGQKQFDYGLLTAKRPSENPVSGFSDGLFVFCFPICGIPIFRRP